MDQYDRKLLDEGTEKILVELFVKILSVNAGYLGYLMYHGGMTREEANKCLEELSDKASQRAEEEHDKIDKGNEFDESFLQSAFWLGEKQSSQ